MSVIQEELAGPKGTPVTVESFLSWRKKFEVEMAKKRALEIEAEVRALPPKERKERQAYMDRLTGRQIYEKKRGLLDEEEEEEEGVEAIDISKFEREERTEEEEEEHGLLYSDSD